MSVERTEKSSQVIEEHDYEWLQTNQGEWVIASLNARHFSGRNQSPTSSRQSHALQTLERQFGDQLHQQDRLYILIGSDSGHLIRYVRAHQASLPRGTRWIFIEPPVIHAALMEHTDISEHLDEYIHLITPDQWEETSTLLQINGYFKVDGVTLKRSLACMDAADQEYDRLIEEFDSILTGAQFYHVAHLNQAHFIPPQLLCAPNFNASVSHLKGCFSGKTAVVIGGGPSLDTQIDWIKQHRDQLFLIAVSRVSRRLQQAEIVPDVVTTVDPNPISLTVSREVFNFPEQTVLVSGNHAYPTLTNRWPHTCFYTGRRVPWTLPADEDLEDIPPSNFTGPTVTHMSVQLANLMGFSRIILCGLDLCHAPDGQSHATGSDNTDAGPLLNFSAIGVETNSGEKAWTSPDYFAGIKSMENMAAFFADRCRLINPSAQAALIKGVDHIPLSEIQIDAQALDRSQFDQVVTDARQRKNQPTLELLKQQTEQVLEQMRKVVNLAQLGLESNQAYFNLVSPERQRKHKRRMRAIDRMLNGRFQQAASLAQRAAKRAIARTDLPHDFFDLDRKQAERLANGYYDAIRLEAKKLLEPLALMIERTQTRLLEQQTETPNSELIKRYLEFDEPERALWLKQNRNARKKQTAEIEARYQKVIDKLVVEIKDRQKAKRRPKSSLKLVERQFSYKNDTALQQLAKTLEKHHDRHEAKPYRAYALALLHELHRDWIEALAQYQLVVDNIDIDRDRQLLEHALIRLSALNLQLEQPEQALKPLEMAAVLNPAHWRRVSHLALLQNMAEEGITALSKHLEVFPSDVERIKQLIRLFTALELPDGIDFCKQYLPYCTPQAQQELEAMLNEAAHLLDMKTIHEDKPTRH